jgi:putative transposase
VFAPKYRKRAIFGPLRKSIGGILRQLCAQEGVELVEGHALADHVHLCLSIPPKFSVANTVGFLKGSQRSEFIGSSSVASGILESE